MLEKFLEHIKNKKKSQNNLTLLNYSLRKVQDSAGKPLDDLTYEEVQGCIKNLTDLSDSSLETIQRKLIQYYNFMFNYTDDPKYHKMVRQLKEGKISRPKAKVSPVELVSPEEVKKLINVANTERDKCLIAVLFEGGLRVGELLALTNNMVIVDDKTKEVKFHIPNEEGCKTGARTVLCLEIYPHVIAWLKCNSDNPDDKFVPLGAKQIRNIVAGLYKKAGINKLCHPHMLRHSAITYMASIGASETELSLRFWGITHSSMVTTYIHLSEQQKADSYRNRKGMGEEIKVAINPLATRCVECGDHIISGSLCSKCEKIKLLSEKDKVKDMKIEALTKAVSTLSKIINDNASAIEEIGQIKAIIKESEKDNKAN
jgi:site-specific recombinase XerD